MNQYREGGNFAVEITVVGCLLPFLPFDEA